jgi:hypothetical protein
MMIAGKPKLSESSLMVFYAVLCSLGEGCFPILSKLYFVILQPTASFQVLQCLLHCAAIILDSLSTYSCQPQVCAGLHLPSGLTPGDAKSAPKFEKARRLPTCAERPSAGGIRPH